LHEKLSYYGSGWPEKKQRCKTLRCSQWAKATNGLRLVDTLKVIGNTHLEVWERVSRCDWMIADAQKRIAQLQVSEGMAKGSNARPTSTVSKAENVKAELSLLMLLHQLEYSEQWQQQCQTENKEFETAHQGQIEKGREMHKSGQAPDRGDHIVSEVIAKTFKQRESALDGATFDAEILRKIIEDVEQFLNVL